MRTFLFTNLFLLSLFTQIKAQSIVITPPEFATPCGLEVTYSVEVQAETGVPIEGGNLTYNLPDGLAYVVGSLSGMNFSEADTSNLNEPVFALPNPHVGIQTFTFQATPTCAFSEMEGALQDEVTLTSAAGTQSFTSDFYNQNNPFLPVSNFVGESEIVNVGGSFIRSFQVTNTGFGEVQELFLIDTYNANVLSITNSGLGTGTANNPLMVTYSAADFMQIGDGDAYLEQNETIIIEELVEVLACGDGASTIQLAWGCNGVPCQFFDTLNFNVNQENNSPDLVGVITNHQLAAPCQDGFLSGTITNTATEITEGAVTAYDVLLQFGVGVGGSNQLAQDDCLMQSNFMIAGNIVTATTAPTGGYQIDCQQFTSDPDGVGGLADLDNDGFFDDLPTGESIDFSFDVLWGDCFVGGCPEEMEDRIMRYALLYTDQCDDDYNPSTTLEEFAYDNNILTIPHTFTTDGEEVTVGMHPRGRLTGLEEVCPNSAIEITIQLPDNLAVPADFAPTYGGNAMAWNLMGTTLTMTSPINGTNGFTYNQFLSFVLVGDCEAIIIDGGGGDGSCAGLGGAVSMEFDYTIDYYCDPDCSDALQLYCDTSPSFGIVCDQPGANDGTSIDMFGERQSLGWTDSTLVEKVTLNSPNLNLQNAFSGDTIKLTSVVNILTNGANLDTTIILFQHLAPDNAAYYQYLTGTAQLTDIETGDVATCPITIPTNSYFEGPFYRDEFSVLDLLNSACWNGYELTTGDIITLEAFYVVTEAVPSLPIHADMSGYFVFEDYSPAACESGVANLFIYNPDYGFANYRSWSEVGCEPIRIQVQYQQAYNITWGDFFPYEFRPVLRWDSIVCRFPEWVTIVPDSSKVVYRNRLNNQGWGTTYEHDYPINDPEIVIENGMTVFKFNQLDTLPAADAMRSGIATDLFFWVQPHCLNSTVLHYDIEQYGIEDFYDEARRDTLSYENHRQINYVAQNISLTASDPIFLGIVDTASWRIEYCFGNDNGAVNIPNNWLLIDFDASGIEPFTLVELLDNGNTAAYPVLPAGNGEDFWVQIGNLEELSCRTFELKATFTACEEMSFEIRSDFTCDAYPDNPLEEPWACSNTFPSVGLTLQPYDSNLQINLVSSPSDTPLCQEMPFELHIVNGGLGGAVEPIVTLELPADGLFYVPGSSQLVFEGTTTAIDDPIFDPMTETYQWNISDILPLLGGLEGDLSNEYYIQFSLFADCDYVPNSTFSYWTDWRDVCGFERATIPFFSLPLDLEGVPDSFNEFELTMQAELPDACASETTVLVEMIYEGGGPNNTTSDLEFIRLVVPNTWNYVPNSFQNINNIPASEPMQIVVGDSTILEWAIPANLAIDTHIDFQINLSFSDPAVLACEAFSLRSYTLTNVDVPCNDGNNTFCEIDFRGESFLDTITIDRATFDLIVSNLSTELAPPDSELWTFDMNIINTSNFDAVGNLELAIYTDNGNNTFDVNDDTFIENITIDASNLSAGSSELMTLTTTIPAANTCANLWVYLSNNPSSCTCEESLGFEPVTLVNSSNIDTICADNSLEIGAIGLNSYDYTWLPATNLSAANTAQTTYELASTIPPGTVTETIIRQTTKVGGCMVFDTTYLTIVEIGVELVAQNDILCFGDETGSIEAEIAGGIGDITIGWNTTGSTDLQLQNLGTGIYEIQIADTLGCTDMDSITLNEPAELELALTPDVGDCDNENDGSIQTLVVGGTAPYVFNWSDNLTGNNPTNLAAGTYNLTLTDANNCEQISEATILDPEPVIPEIAIEGITCPGDDDGSIMVLSPDGEEVMYSLDGEIFQNSPIFSNLGVGNYEVYIQDSLGCIYQESASMNNPFDILLVAPPDTTINLGDSVWLVPYVHPAVAQLEWLPSQWLSCDTCAAAWSKPLDHIEYTIIATSEEGCVVEDRVNIFVEAGVYAPNVFSPNLDGVNDNFTLYSPPNSTHIDELRIFDRWGNMVFQRKDFSTNDTSLGWDGVFRGQDMNPAVFVYVAEVTLISGETLILSGDVTLVR